MLSGTGVVVGKGVKYRADRAVFGIPVMPVAGSGYAVEFLFQPL